MFNLHFYIIAMHVSSVRFLMNILFILPLGARKIVPLEASPHENEPKTPDTTVQDPSQRKGYQEYAIQQTPYEQAMKTSR